MRILLAHKYMFRGGGTSTYLFGLIDQLEQRGHAWIPFTVAYERTAVDTWSEYFVSAPLTSEQSHYKDMRMSPLAMLKLLGRATYSVEARYKAARLIDDARPEIAYIHNVYNYMSPSLLDACRDADLPIVMRVPDYNLICPELHFLRHREVCTKCLRGGPWHALRHRCLKGSLAATAARVASMYVHDWLGIYDSVDLFITPSAFMRSTLIEAGYDPDRIVHLQSFFTGPIGDAAQRREEDYILYFGRVAPEKGIDTLIRALALLDRPPRLLIAGGTVDDTQEKLAALVEQLDLDCVQFLGHQDREALDRLIAGCLFTVVPSRWYDNCPMSILESFAHAKPVVASNIGGIPEQVAGDCGALFAADDPEALAAAMTPLLEDGSLRARMGGEALRHLESDFSAARHCDRLLEIFEDLIA
ncbi:MAG: glycosyltransferase family 4 protein [Armatimonadota bacterium]|jgi:glycosyltransferase involved in cell wall biosynthesis